MEVLSFITLSPNIIDKFSSFLKEYHNISFGSQDSDTVYFVNRNTGRNEIYFHFLPNNPADEFSYNYTKEEQEEVIHYLGSGKFYSFDIQFRNEAFLHQLLEDFKGYLKRHNEYQEKHILISHPHKGIREL